MAPTSTRTTQQLELAIPISRRQVRRRDAADDEQQADNTMVMGAKRWRSSVWSGLRAALACTIVGVVSLYAPDTVRRHITFPAFSYVVTVIIVTDAALGTALRGAVSAVQATLMGAAPSVVALWLAHRTGAAESVLATSAVVALTAFAVALPESVGPVAKRIALGQIIIIYVARFQQGEQPTRGFALVHPANVVACTALGVAAALLAVLLPWPRMATREARDKTRAYRELAAERVRVMVHAIIVASSDEAACSRQRRWQMAACMSEAKRLASASAALLHRIKAIKEDVQWERGAVEDSIVVEMPLKGMQMALAMVIKTMEEDKECYCKLLQEHHAEIMATRDQIRLALLLEPNKHCAGFCGSTAASSSSWVVGNKLLCSQQQHLAPCLFLFSLYQLRAAAAAAGLLLANNNAGDVNKKIAPAAQEPSSLDLDDDDSPPSSRAGVAGDAPDGQEEKAAVTTPTTTCGCGGGLQRLVAAAKCGLSLGLAVLLGLLFSNEHGFWSGLIVATTITAGRESTWAVATARAHGTALGSIYGALGCVLMLQQQLPFRLVALLPWMVLAAFLKRSRAYGPAGGVAAAVSAIIIMGRRYDEPPMAFTMARLVETFIGISCAVVADVLFQPGARPSVKAREQLTRCIATLARCFTTSVVDDPPPPELLLQQQLALLGKSVAEADSEPTYLWLPPFPAACYEKIQDSLGRMAQLLQLYHQAARLVSCLQVHEQRRFSSLVSTSLGHCLRMLQAPPSSSLDHHQEAIKDDDLEAAGNAMMTSSSSCCCCKDDDDEEVVGAFLAHAGEAAGLLLDSDDDQGQTEGEEDTGLLLCSLGSMGLCMREIIWEARQLEAHVIDLIKQPAT
ncbi:hypothetical protein HU200_063812 [Digitaria exilis]|uniref:Integral membrane bound transporter domain-containing protein n=1 Tax=Digitaria exilis TaxID=1010633 RepID=A0A835A595_9POAL|nr:hypothetical protein HU200_063812 [Digitaria exilis]